MSKSREEIQNFNPRLREGGDPFVGQPSTDFLYFNPRLREGGDYKTSLLFYSRNISIHASAKEATNIWEELPVNKFNFNPRLREGGDDFLSRSYYTTLLFQSTPPRRRRPNKYNYRLPL